MNLTVNLALFQALTTVQASATQTPAVPAALRLPLNPTRAPCALLVHANDDDHGILRRLLEAQRLTVHEARSPAAALELAERVRPDIVVLVMLAAAWSAPEAVRALRLGFDMKSLPVIAIADAADMPLLEDCLAAGATDFVLKPVEWSELHLRIRLHLARTQRQSVPSRISETFA